MSNTHYVMMLAGVLFAFLGAWMIHPGAFFMLLGYGIVGLTIGSIEGEEASLKKNGGE